MKSFFRMMFGALLLLSGPAFAIETPKLMMAPVNPAFKAWVESQGAASAELLSTAQADAANGLGWRPSPFDASYLSQQRESSLLSTAATTDLPATYDLREQEYVTSVKNQNPYGTCWAHAACGALESALLKAGEEEYDFSENNMVNLHGFVWEFDDGGNGDMASAYLLRWAGPVLEADDEYPNVGKSSALPPVRHVQDVRWIPARTSFTDNDYIKKAILNYGAICSDYYHDDTYLANGESYYDTKARLASNHAILIVGWDDNYSKSNFKTYPPGNGAFIVKNSWGTSWGDSGYFYVSYYDRNFAMNLMHAFPTPEKADNYDTIYQYDPFGQIGSSGYGKPTAWGANSFVAEKTEQLAAVGFYALVPQTSYTVYIYTGGNANQPRSGTLACSKSGTTDAAGYFTIPLTTPVKVEAKTRFSVVLQLKTPDYNYPIATEYNASDYLSSATANVGESFCSSDGTSWLDLKEGDASRNFCCKAYMKAIPDPIPALDEGATAEDVAAVLSTAADTTLTVNITTLAEYIAFREWVTALTAVTAQEVKESATAWLSYAFAATNLIETPEAGDLTVESLEFPSAESLTFTVNLKGVDVSAAALEANLKKCFEIKGCAKLGNGFTTGAVSLTGAAAANGGVKLTIKPQDSAAESFFFKVELK